MGCLIVLLVGIPLGIIAAFILVPFIIHRDERLKKRVREMLKSGIPSKDMDKIVIHLLSMEKLNDVEAGELRRKVKEKFRI